MTNSEINVEFDVLFNNISSGAAPNLNEYEKSLFLKRNRYLVENADRILAAYNGDPHSGTGITVRYAHQRGVKVSILPLEKKSVSA